ncbi:MAG: hypothetical protein U0872_00400 [Planctomycetaceae bacterium]
MSNAAIRHCSSTPRNETQKIAELEATRQKNAEKAQDRDAALKAAERDAAGAMRAMSNIAAVTALNSQSEEERK